ncbi:hypothetical protein BDV41DRAFT_559417, partial [Aspergillus transmontanensis]
MCRIPSFHQSWQFSSFLIPLSLFFSLFRLFLYNSNSLQLDSTSRRQEVRGQFRPAFFVLGVPVRYIHCPDSLSNVQYIHPYRHHHRRLVLVLRTRQDPCPIPICTEFSD